MEEIVYSKGVPCIQYKEGRIFIGEVTAESTDGIYLKLFKRSKIYGISVPGSAGRAVSRISKKWKVLHEHVGKQKYDYYTAFMIDNQRAFYDALSHSVITTRLDTMKKIADSIGIMDELY